MSSEQQIEEVVHQLVQSHFEIEEGIDEIVWLKDGENKEIRLIEINRNTLPIGSVLAFYFAPSEDVPFPVRIADVTPQEWKQVQSGDISLPPGWTLRKIQIFHR
ncbi:hypothetical protein FJZ31_00840 [Candidatus Poribacteria bacterium]|nr:hypothetical protein [Candidatus Poribacteria bacterium]